MRIGVCWKWVSLDTERIADPRWSGVSDADEAALETALWLAEAESEIGAPDRSADTEPASVHVVCLGPPAADDSLRDALAAGATSALRVDADTELDSRIVADALTPHLRDCDLILCGDMSVDRGTGSVPAYLAGELGYAQALGLVHVAAPIRPGVIGATRRLDGGRREILEVTTPAVLSVEGSVARLRRAPLAASLAAGRLAIESIPGPHGHPAEAEIHPYRPRARTLPAPHGDTLDRVRQILDVGGGEVHAELVTLDPPAAAGRILAQLREWGYLDPSENG